jgi:hypothetical protein
MGGNGDHGGGLRVAFPENLPETGGLENGDSGTLSEFLGAIKDVLNHRRRISRAVAGAEDKHRVGPAELSCQVSLCGEGFRGE